MAQEQGAAMGDELARGIALATAWSMRDSDTWATLAEEGLASDPFDLIGELSHMVVQLATAVATTAGEGWTPEKVLQYFALDAEEGEPDETA